MSSLTVSDVWLLGMKPACFGRLCRMAGAAGRPSVPDGSCFSSRTSRPHQGFVPVDGGELRRGDPPSAGNGGADQHLMHNQPAGQQCLGFEGWCKLFACGLRCRLPSAISHNGSNRGAALLVCCVALRCMCAALWRSAPLVGPPLSFGKTVNVWC